jgi:small-conductance mechanosensitive channel
MEQKLLQFIPPDFGQRAAAWGTKFLVSLLIFIGFLIASLIVKKIICRVSYHSDPQKQGILTLIGDIARIALLIFGFVTALGTLGINVSALVAGLGLTGFALGFAFRDALSNVLAGVMILIYHPFYRGDHVNITGLEGEVTGIDLRYTTLRNEAKTFLIPNSLLLTNPIVVNKMQGGEEKPKM